MPTRRYALLAIGGTVALAGCSNSEISGDAEDSDSDESTPESDSDEDTNESENDSDENSTEEEPESEEEEDEEEEEEEEDEPTQEELFEQAIEDVEAEYKLALAEFAKASDHEDATFLHVLPSTEFDIDDLNNARDYAESGSDLSWDEAKDIAETDEQVAREREYRQYGDIIMEMGRVQRYIYNTYTVLEPPEDETNYDRDEFEEAKDRYDGVDEELEEFEIYMEEIESKHDQQDWQIEQLERTFDAFDALEGSLDPDLLTPEQLQFARDEFEEIRDELEDPESAPPEDVIDEEYAELMDEWYEATDEAYRELVT